MKLPKIDGIVPVLPTPFTDAEEIDWEGLRAEVEFAHAAGVCAACLPAYASEFYKLSEQERLEVVVAAVDQSSGRIPIIAQVNFASAKQAAENVKLAQDAGAAAVSMAVPRMFALSEADLLRYFERALRNVEIPVIIQDFNPSGGTVGAQFAVRLHDIQPHFRYLKLEEPLMAGKVEAIRVATGGEVGVLEGWGGMYMLDLIPAGVCGVMSGLAIADLLGRSFQLAKEGGRSAAYEIFHQVLPQIVCSLQNLEFFHHAEKKLLVARGVLKEANVRNASMTLGVLDAEYIDFLNGKILSLLDQLGMPRNPACG